MKIIPFYTPLPSNWQHGKPHPLRYSEHSVARRTVDVRGDPTDFLACMLGSLGFSTECIQKYTHLSAGQVSYRLRKGGVSRKDFRSGNSLIAKQILRVAPTAVTPLLNRNLKMAALQSVNPPPR